MKNIVVIGGGNMGFTYAEGIYNANIAQIEIIDASQERVDYINNLNKMKASTNYEAITNADVLFLAVKPQIAPEVFTEISSMISNQLVISVMAGTTIETIQKGLNVTKVVRCMPNLPASIQQGMTTYVASTDVTTEELTLTDAILSSTGKAFEVKNEAFIDYTTGVSGSGPAYVFYFMEAMEQSAQKLGFDKEQARDLVSQTFLGAVNLYQQNDISLEEWMNRVASKGGTTRAALDDFASNDVSNLIDSGVVAAVKRAEELGGK